MDSETWQTSESQNRGLPQGEKIFRVKNLILTFGYSDYIYEANLIKDLPDVDPATIRHVIKTEVAEGRLIPERIKFDTWRYLRVPPVTVRRIPEQSTGDGHISANTGDP